MKKVLILGAGVYQYPLIKKVQALGHRALVVSVPGNYPGVEIADEFHPLNTADIEAVTQLAQNKQVDAVLTTGTDVAVPTIGAIVDRLGLPGTGYEASLKSMDKVAMKVAMQASGVATAAFAICHDKQDAIEALRQIGFPAMVKATGTSGSRGISRIDSLEELDGAWENASAHTRPGGAILVETCLQGTEFGAQAFIKGNEVVALFPHNDTVTEPPFYTPVGHSMPASLDTTVLNATSELVQQAVTALGIQDTVSNVDLMLVDNKPYIIEIGARMGATCLPENISSYTGCDVYEFLVRLALGENPDFRPVAAQPNAALLLQAPATGVLKEVIIPKSVQQHPDIIDLKIDVDPGDEVRKFVVGPDRIGHLVVKSGTARGAEELACSLAGQIRFEVEPVEETE